MYNRLPSSLVPPVVSPVKMFRSFGSLGSLCPQYGRAGGDFPDLHVCVKKTTNGKCFLYARVRNIPPVLPYYIYITIVISISVCFYLNSSKEKCGRVYGRNTGGREAVTKGEILPC